MAVLRDERSLARFQRVSLVLSGGGALGAYQAGAYAAMEAAGFEPDWVAGVAIGSVNAAIVAGNPARQRVDRLRSFWTRVEAALARRRPRLKDRLLRFLRHGIPPRGGAALPGLVSGALEPAALRALISEHVDFGRVNAGTTRLSLAAVHLATGAEVIFDNDRHVIGPDHVLASAAPSAGLGAVWIGDEPYGNTALLPVASLAALFEGAAPADTLLFLVDGFDPAPASRRGTSRAGEQIADLRRSHDLRRVIGLIGERLPAELRADPELRSYLAHGTSSTMNLVHLVHESSAVELARKLGDYARDTTLKRWRAGERDMAASLAKPAWLAPPPRRKGVVIHELRGTGMSSAG